MPRGPSASNYSAGRGIFKCPSDLRVVTVNGTAARGMAATNRQTEGQITRLKLVRRQMVVAISICFRPD
jgi:hypothetical protein